MCIGEETISQESVNDRLHTHSTFRCFYALNLRQHRDIPESSPHRYITHILSHNHYLPMRTCEEIRGQKSQKRYVYKHTVDFSLLSWSQLPSTCCKHRGMLDWSPHRYPARILSHNHYLPMCICEEIAGHTSQKCLIIHTQSTFRCLDALHFLPLAANIEVSRNQVHTGIQHTFCLITTTIACVFVKKQKVKSRRKARSYPHSRLFDAFMLSTSAPHVQTWRHFGHMSTQVHRTHSVS